MLRVLLFMTMMMVQSFQVSAQEINGVVMDGVTKKPITNAKVMTHSSVAFTSFKGHFSLKKVRSQDTLRVNHVGYEAYSIRVAENTKPDTVVIFLIPKSIILQTVTIRGLRHRKLDSLKRRADFDAVFSYKKPVFNDHFIIESLTPNGHYRPFQNATSSLVSLDVLSTIGWFSRNKTPIAKLRKRALKEEELLYIDHVFSKEKIRSVTSLTGDSLQYFINEYRPSLEIIKRMDDYQILLYIKKCYQDFKNEPQLKGLPSLH